MNGSSRRDDGRRAGGAGDDEGPLDLRPFRTIGLLGDLSELKRFLHSLAAHVDANRQVVVVARAIEKVFTKILAAEFDFLDVSRLPELFADPSLSSLLVLASAKDEGELERLRAGAPSQVTVRTIYLDRYHDVDALVAFSNSGRRSLFVRPELKSKSIWRNEGETASETFFERPPEPIRPGLAVLGPVIMTGDDLRLERHPKLIELVVYLALHPEGVTTATWTAALWPERRVPVQTIANRLSEARLILGFATDGRPRLRREGERYFLVDFDTDWSSFQRLSSSDSVDDWKAALTLVRGRPFDELAQGDWVIFEGFASAVERSIGAVAIRLGEWSLANNAELSWWAAQQALRACPFDERLHRLIMRSADALGDRAGITTVLERLAMILELEGNPLDGVHRETAELYSQLMNRKLSRS